jgi:hypothetical protein
VLRRDWQPPGGLSEIKIIEGGTAQAYPAVGTAANQWNRRPGIMDDQPLYLQQVNGTLLGTRIDLRAWSSHGGVTAAHEMAKTYLETVGAEVLIGRQQCARLGSAGRTDLLHAGHRCGLGSHRPYRIRASRVEAEDHR